ncbi:hypothetical protein M0R72_07630 [Candidatus Pacearchaeota archaeon]|jgi:hypothetical protein|nr:hypothetical protein [Candidatus Pacearchaeota archaeon]
MDQNQKLYAMARVKEVLETRTKELKVKFTSCVKEASDRAKLDAIRDNDVELRGGAKLTMTLAEAFYFGDLVPAEVLDADKYEKALAELNERAAKVKDRIMLGDSRIALQELQAFLEENNIADSKSKAG